MRRGVHVKRTGLRRIHRRSQDIPGTRSRRRQLRLFVVLFVVGLFVGAAATASAYFVESSSGDFALATAGTIGPPTNFTSIAASSTSTDLSWAAPSNPSPTSYILSQSPGTLAGCSATPTSSTTSCTATGLTPGISYSWTLTAVYDSWTSMSVEAGAMSPPPQTPEVSAPILLPATAASIIAVLLLLRRRWRIRRC